MEEKTYDVVTITWEDTASNLTWQSLKEARKESPAENISVGIVLNRTEKKVVICQSLAAFTSGYMSADNTLTIPRSAIKNIVEEMTITWTPPD